MLLAFALRHSRPCDRARVARFIATDGDFSLFRVIVLRKGADSYKNLCRTERCDRAQRCACMRRTCKGRAVLRWTVRSYQHDPAAVENEGQKKNELVEQKTQLLVCVAAAICVAVHECTPALVSASSGLVDSVVRNHVFGPVRRVDSPQGHPHLRRIGPAFRHSCRFPGCRPEGACVHPRACVRVCVWSCGSTRHSVGACPSTRAQPLKGQHAKLRKTLGEMYAHLTGHDLSSEDQAADALGGAAGDFFPYVYLSIDMEEGGAH